MSFESGGLILALDEGSLSPVMLLAKDGRGYVGRDQALCGHHQPSAGEKKWLLKPPQARACWLAQGSLAQAA